MGATPITAFVLLAFLLLVVLKFILMLGTTSSEVQFAKEGNVMKRAKLWFAAALDTCHGLGANGWVSYLLTKTVMLPNKSFQRTLLTERY